MRCLRGTLCAALLLTCLPWGGAAAENVGLFSADVGATTLLPPAKRLLAEDAGSGRTPHGRALPELPASGELRSRSARIDFGQLSAVRLGVERGSPARLNFNLFADAQFDAVIERATPTASGYTLTGRLADEALSMVVVAVQGERVAGTVWSSHGVHSIRANGGAATVRQLDLAAFPQTQMDVSAVAPKAASQTADTVQSDDGSVIDLLVVYPPFVRLHQGGHKAMRLLIEQDVAITNAIYRDSGVEFQIALVAAVEADYEKRDPSIVVALHDLINGSDGHMDEVHALRDSYGADLVLLHWGDWPPTDSNVGAAQALDAKNYSDGLRAVFSAVASSVPSAIAHGFGLNMGLYFDRTSVFSGPGIPTSRPVYPYGYGYRAQDPAALSKFGRFFWPTVMYPIGLTIPRFSNPNQKWPDESGVPIGVPGDEWSTSVDGPANAVRALNKIRRYVANSRASASRCAYALPPVPPTVPAVGGEYRIRVETNPGCAWMARADGGGFATVTTGGSGVGSGEVVFQVAANGGWEREVAVLIAGEVYAMRQAGARAVTPVCERPPAISQAISDAVGRPCAEVTHYDLGAIPNLSLVWKTSPAVLGTGMLDGLSGLRRLGIWGSDLQIQPGAFDGLASLNELAIGPGLAALHSGVFDGLPHLHSLRLEENRLTVLKRDAFKGLSDLRYLNLDRNKLRMLELGAFNGLSKLGQLDLGHNDLTTLTPGVFDQLPKLRTLHLHENALTELRPGLFAWKQLLWLDYLHLNNNRLTRLVPGTFDGATLLRLDLRGNSLKLAPGVFSGLWVGILHLSGNGMTKLPVGTFDGLSRLQELYLHDNRLTALPNGLLSGLGEGLVNLRLGANRLRALPLGFFDGLAKLHQLDLSGNPGAPFPLRMELVPATFPDGGGDASTGILVEVAEGAPFDLVARLSASGVELSAQEILVPSGRTRGEAVSVSPIGDGPVTIELSPALAAQHPSCGDDFPWEARHSPSCHFGVRAVAGAPLVMYGLRNQALAAEGAVRFDLPTAFPTFSNGTSYGVELSDPRAVEAVVRDGLLIIAADSGGETTVAVTATGPNGRSATLSFTVTVEQSIRSLWSGWRSALLNPSPATAGNEL